MLPDLPTAVRGIFSCIIKPHQYGTENRDSFGDYELAAIIDIPHGAHHFSGQFVALRRVCFGVKAIQTQREDLWCTLTP